MEYNKFEYREVETYAHENSFSFRTTPIIFSKTDGKRDPHNYEISSDLNTIVYETDNINSSYRGELVSHNNGEIPCSAGYSNICVNFDGTVWPCNTLTLNVGSIFFKSLRDIWLNSEELNSWRNSSTIIPKDCQQCHLYDRCIRCPGLAYMEDGNLYGCSSSAKRIAKQRNSSRKEKLYE